jgi:hypothetical protein
MAEKNHEQIANEFEREADKLAHEGKRVESHIAQTRTDWQRKQQDPGVPGATGDVRPEDEHGSVGSESSEVTDSPQESGSSEAPKPAPPEESGSSEAPKPSEASGGSESE